MKEGEWELPFVFSTSLRNNLDEFEINFLLKITY